MVSLTLSMPEKVKREMAEFPEINWSEIARVAIMQRILLLKRFKEFSKNSELTEEDALRLGSELNKNLSKKRLAENKK